MENPERIDNLLEALGDLRVGDLAPVATTLSAQLMRQVRQDRLCITVGGYSLRKRSLNLCKNKLEMIKYVREVTTMGLADAKRFVESNKYELGADRFSSLT